MENRYDGLLREHNRDILALCPSKEYLWHIMARAVEDHHNDVGGCVLELGCGEGDSTVPVLQRDFVRHMAPGTFHLLDLSQEMLEQCKAATANIELPRTYVNADAIEYLQTVGEGSYGVAYSSWMVHNLPWESKRELFAEVHRALQPGGAFVLMDKVYPQLREFSQPMLSQQLYRYEKYLAADVAEAICQHEQDDFSDMYRMDMDVLLDELGKLFPRKLLLDRVEREVLIVAVK